MRLCMCFSYLLLCNKLSPKLHGLKWQILITSQGLWVTGITGWWFWLRVSHQTAVRMLAGATFIWRFDWGWRICFPAGSFVWPLEAASVLLLATCRRPTLLTTWASRHMLECPQHMAANSPQSEWSKQEEKATVLSSWPSLRRHASSLLLYCIS